MSRRDRAVQRIWRHTAEIHISFLKKMSWCEFAVSHFCSTKCSSIGLWLHESYECLSHETVVNHIQISLILVKSCDDNSGIWCVIKRCKSESIWPRNIVIFPFGNCDQQVIGLLKQVLDSLTSWQRQWHFSDPCSLGDSYGPIAYESQLGFILCHCLHDFGGKHFLKCQEALGGIPPNFIDVPCGETRYLT